MRHSLTILITCIFFCTFSLRAQRTYTGNYNNANELLTDVTGKPIYLKTEYNIEGTPFFPAEYTRATLITSMGKRYNGIKVKFNLMDNLLIMLMDDGKELVTVTPMYRVIYEDQSLPA